MGKSDGQNVLRERVKAVLKFRGMMMKQFGPELGVAGTTGRNWIYGTQAAKSWEPAVHDWLKKWEPVMEAQAKPNPVPEEVRTFEIADRRGVEVPTEEPAGHSISLPLRTFEILVRNMLETVAAKHLRAFVGPAADGVKVSVSLEWSE